MEEMVVSKYPDVIEIASVQPLAGFAVRVTFTDGSRRVIDLESYLFGPVFEPIRSDPSMFRRVFVDHGALTWPNGADIDTDTLYYDGPPPWAQKQSTPQIGSKVAAVKPRTSQQATKRGKSKPRIHAVKSRKRKPLRV